MLAGRPTTMTVTHWTQVISSPVEHSMKRALARCKWKFSSARSLCSTGYFEGPHVHYKYADFFLQ